MRFLNRILFSKPRTNTYPIKQRGYLSYLLVKVIRSININSALLMQFLSFERSRLIFHLNVLDRATLRAGRWASGGASRRASGSPRARTSGWASGSPTRSSCGASCRASTHATRTSTCTSACTSACTRATRATRATSSAARWRTGTN